MTDQVQHMTYQTQVQVQHLTVTNQVQHLTDQTHDQVCNRGKPVSNHSLRLVYVHLTDQTHDQVCDRG